MIVFERILIFTGREAEEDMNGNILLVDDEKSLADLIEIYLKNDGYTVHKFYKGMDALKCVEENELDLAILDVMLPDIDGFRLCQKIREKYFSPIIMLTAKVEDVDKIMGLTMGADDYIIKPFNPIRASNTGGSGLGLAIAKQIVELHHGEIRAESSDNRICFTVRIPFGKNSEENYGENDKT